MVESEAKLILQMLFAQGMISSQKEGLQIGDQDVYPAQSAAVLAKDLVMVGIPLTQRGAKRPEGVAIDFAAKTSGTLGNGTHCRRIQFGNLYFEETGMPLL